METDNKTYKEICKEDIRAFGRALISAVNCSNILELDGEFQELLDLSKMALKALKEIEPSEEITNLVTETYNFIVDIDKFAYISEIEASIEINSEQILEYAEMMLKIT